MCAKVNYQHPRKAKYLLLKFIEYSTFVLLLSLYLLSTNINANSKSLLIIPCTTGQMGGKIFIDLNANGIDDSEAGAANVSVSIYSCAEGSNNPIETVTSDSNGDYYFTDPSIIDGISYRIEFSELPDGFTSSIEGTDNGTGIQFVEMLSCQVDYGIFDPEDFCSDDPLVAVVCFARNNDPVSEPTIVFVKTSDATDWPGPQNANDNNGLWGIPSGSNATNYPLTFLEAANIGEINTTFGMDFDVANSRIFTGSYMRAYAPMNTNSSANGYAEAAIYQIPMDLENAIAETPSVWLDLEDLFGDGFAGSYLPDGTFPGPASYGTTGSNPDLIGYTGLGSIKISADGSELYAVNLDKREVLVIPVGPTGAAPTNASDIKRFSLPDTDCGGTWADGRDLKSALGLGIHPETGKVYATLTCTGPTYDDMTGYVYSFDPSDDTPASSDFNLELTIDLNIERPATSPNTARFWGQTGHPWESVGANSVHYLNDPRGGFGIPNEFVVHHNQPWLGEIEFGQKSDGSYSMIVGERNRYHDLISSSWYVVGGVIFRACGEEGNWQLSSEDDCAGETSTVNFSYSGTSAGVYTSPQNRYMMYVGREGSMGSGMFTLAKDNNSVVSPVMDNLFNSSTSGLTWIDYEDGGREKDIRIIGDYTGGGFNETNFTKANNWGAITSMCENPPIQLGNYVWIDTNGDGVQDPCEDPVEGLIVKLYSKSDTGDAVLAATTTTSSDGEYYFSKEDAMAQSWTNGFTQVEKDSSYYIVFCGDNYDSAQNLLDANGETYILTLADAGSGSNSNFNDSDGSEQTLSGVGEFIAICITANSVDHTLDLGLILKPTVTVVDTDISCGPVSDGGVLAVNVEGGSIPFSFEWSDSNYNGMDLVQNAPPGIYSVTLTDGAGCTSIASAEITIEPCLPNPCIDGELGGSVFNDENANGINEDSEIGFQGTKVQLFVCNENGDNLLVETVYTDPNGDYHFTNSEINFDNETVYQIVFSNLPEDYIPSSLGGDNGTDVQYVTQFGCDNDYAILHPDFACTAPDFEESVVVGEQLFSSGTLLGPGIALITCGTIINLPEDERHTVGLVDIKGINTANNRPEVNPNAWYHSSWSVDNIGNVFGIDYDTTGNIYVTASSHYSHIYGYILGPDASNYTQAIIKYGDLGGGTDDLDAAGTVYKLDAVTGEASVFVQLPQQAFSFNHYACEAADPPLARTTGPGLGNIVFDQANNQFFVSNFEDGKIYRIDTQGDTIHSFDPQTLGVFDPYDGTAGWATDAKPYGLAVNKN